MTPREILGRLVRLRVLVIGDVMLDHYIRGDAERLSPEAPVPVVAIDRDTYVPGGAANVAVNLAELGAAVELGGSVGRDDAGRRLRSLLRARRVAFDRARWEQAERPTIVKARVIVRNQQMCRLDREAPPAAYAVAADLAESIAAEVGEQGAVVLSDYAKGVLTGAFVQRVIDACRAAGVTVAVDPKPKNRLAHKGVDLMTPNRREALELAGLDPHGPFDAGAVCREIHRRHRPRNLVVTLGEQGMLLSRGGVPGATIPTAAREVFDVSGAGDTAIAAITAALAVGAPLEAAARFGNLAAGVVVGKLGTATASPEEILAAEVAVAGGVEGRA